MSLEGHSFRTKIDWPSPDVVWKKALKTVEQKMTFETESGEIGKTYLGGGSLVISARQAVVIEGRSLSGPNGDSYEGCSRTNLDGVVPVRCQSGSIFSKGRCWALSGDRVQ